MMSEEYYIPKESRIKDGKYIYALINPIDNSVFYVGRTDNPKVRWYSHFSSGVDFNKDSGFYYTCVKSSVIRAIRKEGLRPIFKILETVKRESDWEQYQSEVDFKEIFWTQYFSKMGYKMTNQTELNRDITKTHYWQRCMTDMDRERAKNKLDYAARNNAWEVKYNQ